jgi:hypothetical protein
MNKTLVFDSYESFLSRDDKRFNGVSPEFAEKHPDYEKDNATNIGCWNCSGCSRCYDCYDCHGVSGYGRGEGAGDGNGEG